MCCLFHSIVSIEYFFYALIDFITFSFDAKLASLLDWSNQVLSLSLLTRMHTPTESLS